MEVSPPPLPYTFCCVNNHKEDFFMKALIKTSAILGMCLFMGRAFATDAAATVTDSTMKSPQATDTTRTPQPNIPSAESTDTTYKDTYKGTAMERDTAQHQAIDNLTASKTQVRSIQSALSTRGYDLAVDGMMGPNTQSALKRFQRDQGLNETGRIDSQTLNALDLNGSTDFERVPSSMDDNN